MTLEARNVISVSSLTASSTSTRRIYVLVEQVLEPNYLSRCEGSLLRFWWKAQHVNVDGQIYSIIYIPHREIRRKETCVFDSFLPKCK